MKSKLVITIVFILISSLGFSQSILKKLDEGEKIVMEITPQGDWFTDPAWFHTYEFSKFNSEYLIILTKDNNQIKKVVSENDLKPFIDYINKWYAKELSTTPPLDDILLKIGSVEKRFLAVKNSDTQLLDIMYKDKDSNSLK